MADIDVERKTGPGIWPWILGLLALALLAWLVLSLTTRDDRPVAVVTDTAAVAPDTPGAAPPAAMPAVEEYQRECRLEEGARTPEMGVEHEFTIECLEQLAAALDEMARGGTADPGVGAQTATIRDRADRIRQSPDTSLEHADWTRQAADAGAEALAALQRSRHPGDGNAESAVARARDAAQQIRPGEEHLDQLNAVRGFFRAAGEALQRLAQPAAV